MYSFEDALIVLNLYVSRFFLCFIVKDTPMPTTIEAYINGIF